MAEPLCSFNMISVNVRGLNERVKRRKVFRWIKNSKVDICFIQEAHSTQNLEKIWRSEWGGTILFSHGSNRARGVAVLIKPGLDFTLIELNQDQTGRYIILDAKIQDKSFKLVNLYAPNSEDDQTNFYRHLRKKLSHKLEVQDNIILGGDWNVIQNITKDRKGGADKRMNNNRKIILKEIETLKEDLQISDIWRVKNPSKERFTWRKKNPVVKSRLDFWLISKKLEDYTENTDIVPCINTDHSAITLEIKTYSENTKGKGLWRLNTSFLKEDKYVRSIMEHRKLWLEEFNNITSAKDKWELIKYRIRQFSLEYGKERAKMRNTLERNLQTELHNLEEEQDRSPDKTQENQLEEKISLVKAKLEEISDYKTQGLILRSQARWHEKGEKSNKYFLQLESRNRIKKTLKKLKREDNTYTTDAKEILQMQSEFYEKLYSLQEDTKLEPEIHKYLETVVMPTLNDEEKQSCEGLLTVEECKLALQSFKNSKAPGNDGIPAEFYKKFWPLFGPLMVAALNESYVKGELGGSQRQAVITLLDKGKDRSLIKNWRPISLLNTDYKIASKAISNRLIQHLPGLIHENQVGYVKERSMTDNIRSIVDTINYLKSANLPGVLINVDFEKAFDSLNWGFLRETLKKVHFGPSFIKWIDLFYTNISSCIVNNGTTSKYFNVSRGVRQGDPLSPYLFIIAVEVMACKIRQDENIHGVNLGGEQVKLLQYADDTNGILQNKKSAKRFLENVKEYGQYSGLRLNTTKTEGMWLGSNRHKTSKPLNILWPDRPLRILGVYVSYDDEACYELNFQSRINKTKHLINLWSLRNLTMYGRAQIIKTFIVSQFLFICSAIATPQKLYKILNSLIFKFIWRSKTERLKRNVLIKEYTNGGLKIPDFETMVKTTQIKWIKKINDDHTYYWKSILKLFLEKLNISANVLLYTNYSMECIQLTPHNIPPFYFDIFKVWSKVGDTMRKNKSRFIWYNEKILIQHKALFYKEFFDAGIWYIDDLYYENGQTIPFEVWLLRGLGRSNILKWISLVNKSKPLMHELEAPSEEAGGLGICLQNNREIPLENMSSKEIYDSLLVLKTSSEVTIPKIAKYLDGRDSIDWKEVYKLAEKIPMDTKAKEFQYRFVNDLLSNRHWLKKWKVLDNANCVYCTSEDEDIIHMFWECQETRVFWRKFTDFCCNKVRNMELSLKDVTCGMKDNTLCFLILIAKMYIYNKRVHEERISFPGFLVHLNRLKNIELQVAENNNKVTQWLQKWEYLVQ